MLFYNVTPNIVEDWNEYWAIHFCSILEFLHYHKQLSEKPSELVNYPNWSLNDLRGYVSNGYYVGSAVRGSMENWAFQYFLLNYLNSNIYSNIFDEIINNINTIYNSYIVTEIIHAEFILTGRDSVLGNDIGINECHRYIPFMDNNSIKSAILNSDFILKLTDIFGFTTGIFCEVESKYGKVNRLNYWVKKNHSLISFSIENSQVYSDGVWLNIEKVGGLDRVKIIFSNKNNIISDYQLCLNWIIQLIHDGRRLRVKSGTRIFDHFLDILISNWSKPVIGSIDIIKSYIKNKSVFLENTDINVPKLTLNYTSGYTPSLFLSENTGWRHISRSYLPY